MESFLSLTESTQSLTESMCHEQKFSVISNQFKANFFLSFKYKKFYLFFTNNKMFFPNFVSIKKKIKLHI